MILRLRYALIVNVWSFLRQFQESKLCFHNIAYIKEGSRPRNKARRIYHHLANVPMTCSLRFCTKTTIACPDSLSSLAGAENKEIWCRLVLH